VQLHRDISIRALTIGAERAPLLVIDNFVAEPDQLAHVAVGEKFSAQSRYYPGIRADAPAAYQQLFAGGLAQTIAAYFGLGQGALRFPLCHFSLVTTPAECLLAPQRIPHVDSLASPGLASIHYLFKRQLGGTGFYRHRSTGFEYVDESRNEIYFRALQRENLRPETAGDGYINGDTALFERIGAQDGVFNRMLIYRRNSLHSGCIPKDFVPDPNPATGRLSINCFIDMGS
jgi:hypothetical protein